MRFKKRGFTLGCFLFIFILIGFASAESCRIVERSSCSDDILMGLSSITNAHGEIASSENYNYVLCCDFGAGDTACTGTNKIIKLSSITNAHAEIPSLNNYNQSICYEDFVCAGRTNSCEIGELEILSLTSNTNAHIGSAGNYSVKICCSGVCGAGREYIDGSCTAEQSAYWANINNQAISSISAILGSTQIKLVLINTGLSQGTNIDFEIYEDDFASNDEIRTGANALSGTVDAAGKVEVTWTPTQQDIDNAAGIGEGDEYEFYFLANTKSSGILILTISEGTCASVNRCMDYTTSTMCESDSCSVATNSVPSDITCGEGSYSCECGWNSNTEECSPSWTAFGDSCGDGIISAGEQCDGSNWGDLTDCSDFDEFAGGILSCGNDCMFETRLCTGGEGGECGDGIIDAGEHCDGSNWGNISSCSIFDQFTGGTLSCGSDCKFNTNSCTGGTTGTCGDGEINTGEMCEGSNWGNISSCSIFDQFTGGTLSCGSDCKFNTRLCTGGEGGECGDTIIDAGEHCDGSNWGPITNCNYFDYFTGGTLSCRDDCKLETELCTGGESPNYDLFPSIGTCYYNEDTNDDCDDGFLTYSWIATWNWDEDNDFGSSNPDGGDYVNYDGTYRYDPYDSVSGKRISKQCVEGYNSVPCPAQVKLPFFGFYNLVFTLFVISLIYTFMILRKKD
ncbi:MAG: hypothetical protein KKF68_00400 [Nanoarchaeota archaeon]|nr:hypothetical protein [Nanoarchaeota archaeon]